MKRMIHPILIVIVLLLIAFLSVTLSGFRYLRSETPIKYSNAAFTYQATTPQPQEDRSEIGSTDSITGMSFILVTIIITPILLKRKSWSQN